MEDDIYVYIYISIYYIHVYYIIRICIYVVCLCPSWWLKRYWMFLISLHVRQGGGLSWLGLRLNLFSIKFLTPKIGWFNLSAVFWWVHYVEPSPSRPQSQSAASSHYEGFYLWCFTIEAAEDQILHLLPPGIRWYHRVEIAVQSTVGQAQNWGAKELPDLVMFKHVWTSFKHFTLAIHCLAVFW